MAGPLAARYQAHKAVRAGEVKDGRSPPPWRGERSGHWPSRAARHRPGDLAVSRERGNHPSFESESHLPAFARQSLRSTSPVPTHLTRHALGVNNGGPQHLSSTGHSVVYNGQHQTRVVRAVMSGVSPSYKGNQCQNETLTAPSRTKPQERGGPRREFSRLLSRILTSRRFRH